MTGKPVPQDSFTRSEVKWAWFQGAWLPRFNSVCCRARRGGKSDDEKEMVCVCVCVGIVLCWDVFSLSLSLVGGCAARLI